MSVAALSSSTIAATVVTELGTAPSLADLPRPEPGPGQALVGTTAAAINGIDIVTNSPYFPFRMPTPYVPGYEGCGVVVESERFAPGARVRFQPPFPPGQGSLSSLCVAPDEELMPVPDEVPDDVAACIGYTGCTAWFALTSHGGVARGDTVLILGATGPVGQAAVQLAKHLGAGRVIGTGRDASALERLRSLGADATVRIAGQSPEQLTQELREAAGAPVNLIIDGLWGAPAIAAVNAAGFGARFVSLGDVAAQATEFAVSSLRYKGMTLYTHATVLIPAAQRAKAFDEVVALVQSGALTLARECYPAERIGEAWAAAASRPHHSVVVQFGARES